MSNKTEFPLAVEALKKEALKEFNRTGWELTFDTEIFEAGFDAAVKALQSELSRLEGGGWVSVEERLPEEDETVLWCRVPVNEPPHVGCVLDTHFDHNYFTHWQPLPNPPKTK